MFNQRPNHAKIAFSNAATSPPAVCTAFNAASLNFFLFSLASSSRRARVLELPLGATSFSNLAESLGVKFTKSIIGVPDVGVLGPLGVRGGLEADRVRVVGSGSGPPASLIGPALWMDFRRLRLWSVTALVGDRCRWRRALMLPGETGGEGDREGDRRCVRGVVNGELSEKIYAGGRGRAGYEDMGPEPAPGVGG